MNRVIKKINIILFIVVVLMLLLFIIVGYVYGKQSSYKPLSVEQKKMMLLLSHKAIENQTLPKIPDIPEFRQRRPIFVSIRVDGKIRGSAGQVYSKEELYKNVIDNSISAIKFYYGQPLSQEEIRRADIEISIIKRFDKAINKKTANLTGLGVYIVDNGKQGALLPAVWADLPKRDDFLSHLCSKIGYNSTCWNDTTATMFTFEVESFSDKLI